MAQDFISWDDDDINLDLLLGDYTDYENEKKSGSQVQNSPVYVCPACMKELKSISGFRGHVSKKHGLDKVKEDFPMRNDEKASEEERPKKMNSIIPYTCVFIDADWRDFLRAGYNCFKCHSNHEEIVRDIKAFWVGETNRNHVLPCLSVRTGLGLYLETMKFPPGSEVIMSAINIPDMVRVLEHHQLKVVPWDVSIETMAPKVELFPSLVTERTVAVLVAHVFGKWCDMAPIHALAQTHNLRVIEDCAEGFSGFERLGHPQTDLSLFSFGVIKFFTAFGGAIGKVRDDRVYEQMVKLYETYSTQRRKEYLKKVVKYFAVYLFLNVPSIIKPAMFITRSLNIDHKKIAVNMLRGFPDQMVQRIKARPSTALLFMLRKRLRDFSLSDFNMGQVKGEYVRQRLPEAAQLVGMDAHVNNYWLFPILVDDPDTIMNHLYAIGIDAYRGATQLNLIEPDPSSSLGPIGPLDPRYPSEARYLIDHVVYLPVHKNVPFHVLNHVCKSVRRAIKMSKDSPTVRLTSKL